MIRPQDRGNFAQHAAPEAIEHQLQLAKAARRAAQRDIEWLAELAGRRAAEIAAGTWPPRELRTPDPSPDEAPCLCNAQPSIPHPRSYRCTENR